MNLAFAREARDELVRLRAFVAKHDPAAAQRTAARPVGDYLVRYLIANDRVIVLRVWHGKEQRP